MSKDEFALPNKKWPAAFVLGRLPLHHQVGPVHLTGPVHARGIRTERAGEAEQPVVLLITTGRPAVFPSNCICQVTQIPYMLLDEWPPARRTLCKNFLTREKARLRLAIRIV